MRLMWPRRAFVALVPAILAGQTGNGQVRGAQLPADWARYQDPATEFEVFRLTSPEYESQLPAPPARAVSRGSGSVLYASNRTGSWQAHLLDLGKGGSRVISAAKALAPESLTYSPDDRAVYYFDEGRLMTSALPGAREQQIYELREGWQRTGALAVSEDHNWLYWVETREGQSELRRMRRAKNAVDTVASGEAPIVNPVPNPKRALLVWTSSDGKAYVCETGGDARRVVDTPAGRVISAMWSPDGQAIQYLHEPADPKQLVSIREQQVDSRGDAMVARTSQYAAFNRNANGTVFLGTSRSKASPLVLVMLRVTRRELALCEHKASDPAQTVPVFSPNSQWVFFESNRHGKPAIYGMKVEKLLEKTDS